MTKKDSGSKKSGKKRRQFINRELSWLAFNQRVLQEAKDPTVPLLTRFKFLAIFSSNLDEFFRVRVASLKRLIQVNKKAKAALGFSPKKTLSRIHQTSAKLHKKFENIFRKISEELKKYNVYIINEKELSAEQSEVVRHYFHSEVRPLLVPLMIDIMKQFPNLKDGSIYFAIKMHSDHERHPTRYSLIEIPANQVSRFKVLKGQDGKDYVILLDDVIRKCLSDIFFIFPFDHIEAYTIKITKDSELDLDADVDKSYLELISESVKLRQVAQAVRFIYDKTMPQDLLHFLSTKIGFDEDDNILPGGRYHNFKDFMSFPKLGPAELTNRNFPPNQHPLIKPSSSFLAVIAKRDIMLHYPYHSFHPMIDFLREAAIDPDVEFIKITLYRVASKSAIINALVSARLNGKHVEVVLELKARFDEAANVEWTKVLQQAGVKVSHGPPNQKVHAKVCLVGRREQGELVRYAAFSTGNFNESTATLYGDDCLFTANQGINLEAEAVFELIETGKTEQKFQHLIVAPIEMLDKLLALIDREIANKQQGKPAYIVVKLNNLNERTLIKKLYEASEAGVKIKLIIRSICCLVPDASGGESNIEAISIIDKYLEHSRLLIFGNAGKEEFYLSSADWMERNIHRRVEVACPIYDKEIQQSIRRIVELQLLDNTKARWQSHKELNTYKRNNSEQKVRCQNDIYDYIARQG